jgi:Skp family chaperone for outer membrane proteins
LAQAEAQIAIAHEKVERLTQAVQSGEVETTQLRKERDQLQARVAKAEAGVEAAQAELQKTAKALERAQEGERLARDEAAELRGQLKAGDDKGKK